MYTQDKIATEEVLDRSSSSDRRSAAHSSAWVDSKVIKIPARLMRAHSHMDADLIIRSHMHAITCMRAIALATIA